MDLIFTIDNIQHAAKVFLKEAKTKKVIAFYAPMGAGKTTFINTLCSLLDIKTAVSSPTFSIINEYSSPVVGTVYHMDWYRLKDEEEAMNAGVEDALLSGNLCLVEWPEKAEGLLPDGTLKIVIEVLDDNTRRIFSYE